MTIVTAAFVVIGNEILSGRTQDKNIHYLANRLMTAGIRLKEVRIIADDEHTIIHTIRELCGRFDHVMTSGGIGPTHDDITAASVALAFEVPLEQNPEAVAILQAYYADQLTDARLRMARIPQGGKLIPNPVSAAPGFSLQNLHVMAGVPRIFQAMVDHLVPTLRSGDPVLSISLSAHVAESQLAEPLEALQKRYPDVEFGSYPSMQQGKVSTTIVARSTSPDILEQAAAEARSMMQQFGVPVQEGEF